MKIIWIGVWLSLESIAAYSGTSGALNGAGPPLSETPAAVRATPPLLNTSAGVIPVDSSSDTQPHSTDDDIHPGITLSEYVFLHRTRNEHAPSRTRAQVNACPE